MALTFPDGILCRTVFAEFQ